MWGKGEREREKKAQCSLTGTGDGKLRRGTTDCRDSLRVGWNSGQTAPPTLPALRQGTGVASPPRAPLSSLLTVPELAGKRKRQQDRPRGPATWPVGGSLNALNRPAANWPNKQNTHLLSSEAREPCRSPLFDPAASPAFQVKAW